MFPKIEPQPAHLPAAQSSPEAIVAVTHSFLQEQRLLRPWALSQDQVELKDLPYKPAGLAVYLSATV